jgi:hypothetical protein
MIIVTLMITTVMIIVTLMITTMGDSFINHSLVQTSHPHTHTQTYTGIIQGSRETPFHTTPPLLSLPNSILLSSPSLLNFHCQPCTDLPLVLVPLTPYEKDSQQEEGLLPLLSVSRNAWICFTVFL